MALDGSTADVCFALRQAMASFQGIAHRLAARIRAGIIWINNHNQSDANLPWGGFKQSGWGRTGRHVAKLDRTRDTTTLVPRTIKPLLAQMAAVIQVSDLVALHALSHENFLGPVSVVGRCIRYTKSNRGGDGSVGMAGAPA